MLVSYSPPIPSTSTEKKMANIGVCVLEGSNDVKGTVYFECAVSLTYIHTIGNVHPPNRPVPAGW